VRCPGRFGIGVETEKKIRLRFPRGTGGGDRQSANALTLYLDLIYGVYGSESMYEESHEVAHILSYQIGVP
jgi:hypothetical protein